MAGVLSHSIIEVKVGWGFNLFKMLKAGTAGVLS